jgi:L-serine kinase (ADP)
MTKLRLVPPSTLAPHEEILNERVDEVIDLLVNAQSWTAPICIERHSRCIMDGHHRHVAALRLGLTLVPVMEFDYREVGLGSWRAGINFEPDTIIDRAQRGLLLPHKSTRHIFPPVAVAQVPLQELVRPAAG